MGVKTLHLIRHGQYVAEPEQRLTDLGRAQAEVLGARLAAEPVTLIRTSTAPRAKETAEILHRRFPAVRRTASDRLLELIPSRPRRPLPEALAARTDAEFDRDGARLATIDPWLRPSRTPRCELWVVHGNLIRAVVGRALGLDPGAWWDLWVDHCGLTTLRVTRVGRFLLRLNDTGHLPPAMVTGQ